MMRRRVDLPAPFAPRTPILAPGKKESQIPRRISRCGGTTFRRLTIVKMYWWGMGGGGCITEREPLGGPPPWCGAPGSRTGGFGFQIGDPSAERGPGRDAARAPGE